MIQGRANFRHEVAASDIFTNPTPSSKGVQTVLKREHLPLMIIHTETLQTKAFSSYNASLFLACTQSLFTLNQLRRGLA